ncbi:unnamed protein product [marine sediment metagenome]|uniref:PIN domain-containing protein n=1 Tax=marine sediment metagenome TaxID=412755 RepID=X1QKR7_9ZZZZ
MIVKVIDSNILISNLYFSFFLQVSHLNLMVYEAAEITRRQSRRAVDMD